MRNGVGLSPFQKFHIDLTGPHRRSAGGHVYLLTGICCFTKYLIAVPLRDKSALTVANALLKHVYLIYGAVELQVHDNGPEFVNSVLSHLSKMMGVQDLRSTAYRPVANAAIERVHRTINVVFAKTIKEHQRDWHEQAKYVCFAYNTAKHTSTTFSPFFLVFLREPRVGIDLFLERSEPGYQNTDENSDKVQERMQKAYQIVSNQLKVTFDRAKRRYDQRVHAVHFPLNSYVWYFCPRLTAGRGRKFRKLTDGPFRVVRILNDVNYVIQKVPGSRLIVCHVDRLIRFEGDPPAVWVRFDGEKDQGPSLRPIQKIVKRSGPQSGTLRVCSVFSVRQADSESKLQRSTGGDIASQQLADRPRGRGHHPNGQAATTLPTIQAASGSVPFNMGPMACIASQHTAPIKGEKIDKLFISILDIEASKSHGIMTTEGGPKSKEFISDSEDSELSDDRGVAVGFSETTIGPKKSEETKTVEGTDPATESPGPVANSKSPSATTVDLNQKSVKDPKQDPQTLRSNLKRSLTLVNNRTSQKLFST